MILQTLRAVVGPLPPAKPGPAFWQSRLHERCPGARPRFRRVISSVVERFVHIEDVGSSNLSSPTSFPQGPCALRSPNALQASDRVKLHARHLPASPVLRRPGVSADRWVGRDCLPQSLGLAKGGRGWAISSVGRALRLHRRCREFESLIAHQTADTTGIETGSLLRRIAVRSGTRPPGPPDSPRPGCVMQRSAGMVSIVVDGTCNSS